MGARPSGFKSGGGFLNDVTGVLSDYEFTNVFPGTDGVADGDKLPLYVVLRVTVEGAEEPLETTLYAGSGDNFEISDDGKTLTPSFDGASIWAKSPFGVFIISLVENGFPEERFPEDDAPINYEAMLGTRVHLVQVVDEEAMVKLGRKRLGTKAATATREAIMEAGRREDKKNPGRSYPLTNLQVGRVVEVPTEGGGKRSAGTRPGGSKKAVNGSGRSIPTTGGKGTTKPATKAAKTGDDIDEKAEGILLGILADNDGSVQKSQLSLLVTRAAQKDPQREELRKLIFSTDFLSRQNGWTFDQSSKQQTVALAE